MAPQLVSKIRVPTSHFKNNFLSTKPFVYVVRPNSQRQKGNVMAKSSFIKPTDSELEILQTLWQTGPATVKHINERLNERKETGYTTTLKLLQIMFEKELVERNENERSHVYTAIVKEEDIQKTLVNKLLETAFSGSSAKLVMQALGNSRPSQDELNQIRDYINKIEKGRK